MKNIIKRYWIKAEYRRRAFTIVEMLIVIFLFSTIILISSSSLVTGFVSGRLYSSSEKDLNRDLGLIMDIIRQKMANANGYYDGGPFATGGTSEPYGFRVIHIEEEDVLAVVSTSKTPPDIICTLIGRSSEGKVYIRQQSCGGIEGFEWEGGHGPISGEEWLGINSKNVQIEELNFTSNPYLPSNNVIPWLTVEIKGKDIRTGAKATFTDTFTIPYETIQRFPQ